MAGTRHRLIHLITTILDRQDGGKRRRAFVFASMGSWCVYMFEQNGLCAGLENYTLMTCFALLSSTPYHCRQSCAILQGRPPPSKASLTDSHPIFPESFPSARRREWITVDHSRSQGIVVRSLLIPRWVEHPSSLPAIRICDTKCRGACRAVADPQGTSDMQQGFNPFA